MKKRAPKVIVAISGGVDSSVAAALLKRAGVEVIGVFMRLHDLPSFKEAEKRAKKIAKILGIPFLSLDLRKEFKKRIIDWFLKEYKSGVTPNPCVVCNKEIKFGLLLEKALKLGADYVATGHYARLRREILSPKSEILNYRYKLLKAKDKNKDQSYFLWMLNQNQLKHILFPVGDYTRKEVEKLARKFKSPFTNVKKSMEICFIPKTINDFFRRYLKPKPGIIVTKDGKKIGEHEGLPFYTIGQRKGMGLSGGPYWVLDKKLTRNVLVITKKERDLYKKELVAKNVNWVSGKEPKLPLKIKAKIRYRVIPAIAIISREQKTKTYKLTFGKSQRAVTPGQSVVFYSPSQILPGKIWEGKGQELLGGGIIC